MVTSHTASEIDEAKEKEDLKKLEAIFFVSGRYLKMAELVSLSDLSPIIIEGLIAKLKEKYESSDSAIEIVEKAGAWKMDVRQEYSYIVNKLATGSAEFSKAEQETLAIIAFKQPIKQSVIIKIRGNKAYEHVRKFAELGLIKKKKEGHTHVISLSEEFYDYFGVGERGGNPLRNLEEEKEKDIGGEEDENRLGGVGEENEKSEGTTGNVNREVDN